MIQCFVYTMQISNIPNIFFQNLCKRYTQVLHGLSTYVCIFAYAIFNHLIVTTYESSEIIYS